MGRTFSRVTIDSIVDVLKALIGTPAGADIATDIAAIPLNKRCEFEQITATHTGDTAYSTLLNITSGSGILYSVNAKGGGTGVIVKITIDGVVLTSATGTHTTHRSVQSFNDGALSFTASDGLSYSLNWEYQDSLKIEYKTTAAGETATIVANYGTD